MNKEFEQWREDTQGQIEEWSKLQAVEAAWNAAAKSCSEEYKKELVKIGSDMAVQGYVQGMETVIQMCIETRKALLDKHQEIPSYDPS